jgi:hypothetical protein
MNEYAEPRAGKNPNPSNRAIFESKPEYPSKFRKSDPHHLRVKLCKFCSVISVTIQKSPQLCVIVKLDYHRHARAHMRGLLGAVPPAIC